MAPKAPRAMRWLLAVGFIGFCVLVGIATQFGGHPGPIYTTAVKSQTPYNVIKHDMPFTRALAHYRGVNIPNHQTYSCLQLLDSGPVATSAGSKVLIVMTADSSRQDNEELTATASNWQAYAERHGYIFRLEHINAADFAPYHFFTARWANLLRFWDTTDAEWILHVDGDTMVLNMQQTFLQYLHRQHHIVLNLRENGELYAAAVLFQRSEFSRCFIKQWVHKGRDQRANYDNGDLMQTVLEYVDPALADFCDQRRENYGHEYVPCADRSIGNLYNIHFSLPIRVYFPREGFVRSHEGLQDGKIDPSAADALWFKCWSTDFIGHGWKAMGRKTWGSNMNNPRCEHLTLEEELEIAKSWCMWYYPGM